VGANASRLSKSTNRRKKMKRQLLGLFVLGVVAMALVWRDGNPPPPPFPPNPNGTVIADGNPPPPPFPPPSPIPPQIAA